MARSARSYTRFQARRSTQTTVPMASSRSSAIFSADQCHHTFFGRGALLREPPRSVAVSGPRSRSSASTACIERSSGGRRGWTRCALSRRRAAKCGQSSSGRMHIA